MMTLDLIPDVYQRSKTLFRSGRTREVAWRETQLKRLLQWMETHEDRILAALHEDLGKSPLEAYGSEVLTVKLEIRHFLKHLRSWSRRERVSPPWFLFPAQAWIQREPFGVVLILSPWNYPLYLTLMPLIAAVAAGNTVVIKPSEFTPHSTNVLAEMCQSLEPGLASVVTGDGSAAQALLEQPFDFIFFTGGGAVGKKVAICAAEKGVPCVLELGGKNLCLIDASAPLRLTARRLVWGKFLNAGQTCLAPDYVRVHRSVYEPLLREIGLAIQDFYGENPLESAELGRLIHERHFDRLRSFLSEGKIAHGGRCDPARLRMEPTILTDVPPEAPVMQEEIFGPVLPVLPYDDLDAVLEELRNKPASLALYLHTRSRDVETKVLSHTRSGSVCLNDHVLQSTVPDLPFGGLGESGTGSYHGRSGFETFSHRRGVMRQSLLFDNPLRYPPSGTHLNWVKKLIG